MNVAFDPQIVDIEPASLHQNFLRAPSKLFLGPGWYAPEQIEGDGPLSGSAWTAGKAILYFAGPSFHDAELVARCSPFRWPGSPPQVMMPFLNGVPLPEVPVPAGFTEVRVNLPQDQLRAMNELVLRFAYREVPATRLGNGDPRLLAVMFHKLAIVPRGGPAVEPRALVSRTPEWTEVTLAAQGIAVPLPAAKRFRVRFGGVIPPDSPVSISLRTRDKRGPGKAFWQGPALRLAYKSFDFDLPGEDPSFLVLQPEASSAALPMPRASLDLFSRGVVSKGSSASQAERPNIFIYLIDTLRSDVLGAYGSQLSLTPRIDAFARDAVTYERTWSSSSWTLPATVSLLSGVYPFEHGVQQMGLGVPASGMPWLPEELSKLGYETALISQWLLGEVTGVQRGFDHYFLDERLGPDSYTKSDSSVARGLFWQKMLFRSDPRRPMFVFFHVIDPHAPYEPPAEDRLFAEQNPGSLPTVLYTPQVFLAKDFGKDPKERAHLRGLYDGEVRHVDREFGAFLDLLRYRGLYDDSLIVLVSDHGEEFYEHGGFDHGRTLYEEVLRVPLIVKYPRQRGAGQRIRSAASTIDVMPTILRMVHVPFGEMRLHGAVLPEGGEAAPQDRPLLAEVQVGRSGLEGPIVLSAVIDGDIKCLRNGLRSDRFGREVPETQAFDLVSDRGELAPLSVASPRVAPCLSALSTWASRAREASKRSDRQEPALAPEEIKRLRSLGYLR